MKDSPNVTLEANSSPTLEFAGRKRRMYDGLKDIDPSLAKMYNGAICILADDANPEYLVLAAHSIRELMEKLPSKLEIPTKAPGGELARSVSSLIENWKQTKESSQSWTGTNWQGKIDQPLTEFFNKLEHLFETHASHGQDRSEGTRTLFRHWELAHDHLPPNLENRTLHIWRNLNRFFIDVSHHRKTTNLNEFNDYLEQLEMILLDRFYPQTFDDFGEINKIVTTRPVEITPQLEELVRKRTANYHHFFSVLDSLDWLEPLNNKGFFTDPPPPIRDGEYISNPRWPDSEYLARMASLPQAQQMVLEFTLALPQTDNQNVKRDIIDIALALPPPLSAQLVNRVKKWIDGSSWGLPTQIASLVLHLATGGTKEQQSALKLTRSLLSLVPQPRNDDEQDIEELFGYFPECQSRYDHHEYEIILEDVIPKLAQQLGEPVVVILRDVLNAAMEICEDKSLLQEHFYDSSHIWRPAIENHEQNHDYSLRHFLLNALRNISEELIRNEVIPIKQVITLLNEKAWPLFIRLALHLLRLFPGQSPQLVEEWLTNPRFFVLHPLHHEYVLLLKESYENLPPDKQHTILGWIESGPDLNAFQSNWKERTGDNASPEHIRRFKRIWQRDYLCFIAYHLAPTWREYYEELIIEHGLPEHPEFETYSESLVGYISPLSVDEIQGMSMSEFANYLHSWEPENTWKSPCPEGLARTLVTYIADEPVTITKSLDLFTDVPLTYIEGILEGLRRAVKDSRPLCWELVLDSAFLNTYLKANGESKVISIQRSIAGMIHEGLKAKTHLIPFELRNQVWAILSALSQNADPAVDDEQNSSFDPIMSSTNSVRGTAFHAILAYAIWVQRHSENFASPQGFEIIPEVRDVLETHLDLKCEKNLSIRAIYGMRFPALFQIDKEWALAHKQSIFPLEPELSAYLDTAWEAYITFCNPTEVMYDALEDYYRLAVSQLSINAEKTELSRSTLRLIEHTMQYFWHGKIGLASNDIINLFMSVRNQAAHSHAIAYIGRTLGGLTDPLSTPVLERLHQLWNRWMMRGEMTGETKELRSFGWWISSGRFEEEWSILQLEKILRLTEGQVDDVYGLIGFLVKVAHKHPALVIECLSSLLENEPKMGMYIFREDKVYAILEVILNSDVPEAKTKAITCVHRLGAKGHKTFGELLSGE